MLISLIQDSCTLSGSPQSDAPPKAAGELTYAFPPIEVSGVPGLVTADTIIYFFE